LENDVEYSNIITKYLVRLTNCPNDSEYLSLILDITENIYLSRTIKKMLINNDNIKKISPEIIIKLQEKLRGKKT